MDKCIGCQLSKGILPSVKIYEDDWVIALMDIDPINDGHVLLITRDHRLDLDELTDNESTRIMQVSKIVLRALKDLYDFDGYSIMQNGGAFNEITHYHYHIFPRYKNDGFGWTFGEVKAKDIAHEGLRLKVKIEEMMG